MRQQSLVHGIGRRIAALGCVLALGLSGCGSGTQAEPSAEPSSGTSAAGTTIKHQFGSTTLTGKPQRIVSLSLQWTDSLLAMGVAPVGYATDPLMSKGGAAPWWDTTEMSGKPLRLTDGLPSEQIAALEPDLILGTYEIADKQTYARLSAIAPTIGGVSSRQVETWESLVRTLGTVLHEPANAQQVIASVEGKVNATADELTGLRGKTFVLAQYLVSDAKIGVVADENDGACRLFRRLGMRLHPDVVQEGERTGEGRVFVSTERVDLLQSDLVAFFVNGGDKSDLADIPGWQQLPATQAGAAAVLDYPGIVALNTPTPLSVPYALDALRPTLEAAADG